MADTPSIPPWRQALDYWPFALFLAIIAYDIYARMWWTDFLYREQERVREIIRRDLAQ